MVEGFLENTDSGSIWVCVLSGSVRGWCVSLPGRVPVYTGFAVVGRGKRGEGTEGGSCLPLRRLFTPLLPAATVSCRFAPGDRRTFCSIRRFRSFLFVSFVGCIVTVCCTPLRFVCCVVGPSVARCSMQEERTSAVTRVFCLGASDHYNSVGRWWTGVCCHLRVFACSHRS